MVAQVALASDTEPTIIGVSDIQLGENQANIETREVVDYSAELGGKNGR